MDDSQDRINVGAENVWKSIRDAIKQHKCSDETDYQELLDEKYAQFIEGYYFLATKSDLTDKESDWLSLVLTDAEDDEELAILLEIVDEITFELIGYNTATFKSKIEQARIKLGGEILEVSYSLKEAISPFENEKDADLPQVLIEASGLKRKIPREIILGRFLSQNCSKSHKKLILQFSTAFFLIAATGGYLFRDSISHLFANPILALESDVHQNSQPEKVREADHCSKRKVGWIDTALEGNKTAYGTTYSSSEFTAAHPFLPPESVVYLKPIDRQENKVTEPVKVFVTDKGSPTGSESGGILVSYATAQALDIENKGVAKVVVDRIVVNNQRNDALTEDQQRELSEFSHKCSNIIDNLDKTQAAIAQIDDRL